MNRLKKWASAVWTVIKQLFLWGTGGDGLECVDWWFLGAYVFFVVMSWLELGWIEEASFSPVYFLKTLACNSALVGSLSGLYSLRNIMRLSKDDLKEQKFYTELLGTSSIVAGAVAVAGHVWNWEEGTVVILGILTAFLATIVTIRKIAIAYLDWKLL